MPSGSASIQPDSNGRLDGLASVAERLRGFARRLPRATPRVAASVTLLGVVASGALALAPQRSAPAPQPARALAANGETAPLAPVKIVGAAPRSDNCAEQVWPYIEQRCLTRAADRPKTSAEVPGVTAPQSGVRATSPAAADRVADAPASPPQVAAKDVNLPIPPGAVPLPPASSTTRPAFGPEGANGRPESIGEPRRRAGRHAYRFRHGHFSNRRPIFAFPF